jgi:hypothetical protein
LWDVDFGHGFWTPLAALAAGERWLSQKRSILDTALLVALAVCAVVTAGRAACGGPGSWNMRATGSPAASRPRMTATSWRLATAFCANTQLGSDAKPSRISAGVMGG